MPPALVNRVVDWLREGYPTGVPQQDYVPLLALLRRRLTDDEVIQIAHDMVAAGMVPAELADIAVQITKATDEMPSTTDIDRVRDHLAFRGWPASD